MDKGDASNRLDLDEVPDIAGWISLAKELASNPPPVEQLMTIPTAPALMALAGIEKISGDVQMTWRCCDLYELSVGHGGPVAETPAEPARNIGRSIKAVEVGHGIDTITGTGPLLNVFSWEPVTVLLNPVEPSGLCVKSAGNIFCRRYGRPWAPFKEQTRSVETAEPLKVLDSLDLAGAQIKVPTKLYGHDVALLSDSSVHGVKIGDSVGIVTYDCVELYIGRYDVALDVLYPLKYITLHLRPHDEVSANSLAMRLDLPLSISSAEPFTLRLMRNGLAELCPHRRGQTIHIAIGGEPVAFRLLLEATMKIAAKAQRPLGSVRAGPAVAIASSYLSGTLRVLVTNPTHNDSQVSIRLAWPLEGAKLISPLGSVDLVADQTGLVRVPAPRACLCVVSLRVKPPQGRP